MRIDRKQFLLYPIVDVASVADPLDYTRQLCAAKISVLQLRDKRPASEETRELARAFVEICRTHSVLSIINDDYHLANALGADGVHVGPNDESIARIKAEYPQLIVGGSAGNISDAQRLVEEGADYLGVGAIFDASVSKPNASKPRGTQILLDVLDAVDVPIVGIGGINFDNFETVLETGAGVAVIRSLIDAPEQNVERFNLAIDRMALR